MPCSACSKWTPAYKPRLSEEQTPKKNRHNQQHGNKVKDNNMTNKNKDLKDSNKQDELSGRTRRRRSAVTT